MNLADSERKIMVSHTLVKDVMMGLGEETEYYIVKSSDSEPLNIGLGKRHITQGPLVDSNPFPRTKIKA